MEEYSDDQVLEEDECDEEAEEEGEEEYLEDEYGSQNAMAIMLNDSENITEECNDREIYGALHQTEAPKKLEQVPASSTGNDHHISSDDKSVDFGMK